MSGRTLKWRGWKLYICLSNETGRKHRYEEAIARLVRPIDAETLRRVAQAAAASRPNKG